MHKENLCNRSCLNGRLCRAHHRTRAPDKHFRDPDTSTSSSRQEGHPLIHAVTDRTRRNRLLRYVTRPPSLDAHVHAILTTQGTDVN